MCVDWPLQTIQMFKLLYIKRMEDTLCIFIAMEADSRAERKSGANDVSLGTKSLFQPDSTNRTKDGKGLV